MKNILTIFALTFAVEALPQLEIVEGLNVQNYSGGDEVTVLAVGQETKNPVTYKFCTSLSPQQIQDLKEILSVASKFQKTVSLKVDPTADCVQSASTAGAGPQGRPLPQ